MGDFIAKAVNGGAITEFPSAPVELAATLAPGQYDLRPIGGPVQRVTVLDVQNTVVPTVSGTPSPGQTLTGTNGTWSGVLTATTPYEYRWWDVSGTEVLIPGAVSNLFDVPASGYEGKLLAYEVRAQTARGQWTGWVRAATITIANLSFNVTNAEWTWAEDASDAQTRQGYATLTLLADLPPGKRPRFYRGPNAAGNSTQTAWMVGAGRNWIFDAANPVAVGVRDYGAIYMQTDDGAGNPVGPVTQISSIKFFDASNVPSKPGAHTAVAGTVQTGDVVIDPNNTPPASNGRGITGYGYSVDGGAVIALSGGTAVTARTVTISSSVSVAVRVHAQNANGWSVGSDPVNVTPPTITAGTNTVLPSIGGAAYAGGQALTMAGEWTGSVTITTTIEQSDNGSTGWTTASTPIVSTAAGDTWNAALATKYLRIKETPSIGSPAYSSVFGPLGAAYSHVLSLGNNNNFATHTVTPPFLNATATGGLYLGAIAYFDGTTWDAGGQGLFSMGQISGTTNHISVCGNGARMNGGSSLLQANLPDPGSPGWYICVIHMVQSGSTKTATFLRNDERNAASSTSGSYTFTAAQWNGLKIGMTATSSASNGGANVPIDCVFAGKGDPSAFVEWVFNGGQLRKPTGYNFGTDPNGATMDLFMDLSRVGAATFNEATHLIDSLGPYDSWTMTAPQGSFYWTDRKPSYVMPDGDPLPIPIAYLAPGFGTTTDIFSIESGKFGGVASTAAWVTARSYGVNQRVTQGGNTYRCLVAHTSGTFATDLSANNWALFSITVNTLTHSVLGDIRGSLVGYAFTCGTPGLITGTVTLNGTAVAISAEVRAARGIPAVPQYAAAFNGNGLLAAIEPYPTPAGAATSFASIAALQTAISGLAAGGTLIVDNLDDLNGATLTIPGRDYGGATIICKNWEGVKAAACTVTSVQNLNMVGFAFKGGVTGTSMNGNVTFDHCRTSHYNVDGANDLTFNFSFTNSLCWDVASGIPNGYSRFNRINRLTGLSWIMERMDNAVAVFQMYKVGTVIFDRFFAWAGQYTGSTHPDLIQLTRHSSQGYMCGDIRNGMGFHRITTGAAGFQGLFLTDNKLRHLRIKNVIMDVSLKNAISLAGAQWNVRIEDCTGMQLIGISSGYPDSASVSNCVLLNATNSSTQNVLQTPGLGYETGSLGLAYTGLARGDLWPQYDTWLGSWRAYANPNAGYETRGAATLIAELEAKRVALGI